jgi:hypothetical protein
VYRTGTKKLLHGTALFNNDGHQGQVKTRARSVVGAAMITDSNAKRGPDWAEYSLFTPTEAFIQEIEQFENHAKAILQPQYESKYFQGLDGQVMQNVPTMYNAEGDVLMIALPIKRIWPQFDADIENLYRLAVKNLPKHNRSKHPTRKEYMHSFGVKQLGMGDNSHSIMLKMEPHDTHDAFVEAAARHFCKQNILERLVVPDNSHTRLSMRDELVAGSACAIPGLEDYLWALACSITEEYYPELHFDTPRKGTLECILFSSSDEAVFAGKCSDLTEIIKLDEPKLILLDSKRLKHAAQRNVAAAQAAFN